MQNLSALARRFEGRWPGAVPFSDKSALTLRPAAGTRPYQPIKKLQGADMKLAFFDNYKLGVVVGDKIVDVSAVTKGIKALGPQDVIRGVIEKWSSYKGKLAAAAKKGKGKPLA